MPLVEQSTLAAAVAVAEKQKVPGFTTGSIKPIIVPPTGENMSLEEATRGGLSDRVKLGEKLPQNGNSNVVAPGGGGSMTLMWVALAAAVLWFMFK